MLGTSHLKTAIVRKLRAQFNTASVPYIPSDWNTIIQSKPTVNTPYPYICVEIDANDIKEVAVTDSGSSYDYFVSIKSVTRSKINADTRQSRDSMVTEVQRILDVEFGDYINLSNFGFNIYVQTVESVSLDELNEMGTEFYSGDVTLRVRMETTGSKTAPVASPTLTYSDFTLEPQNNTYELHDSGVITLSSTYPNSNGWQFSSVDYSLASDSDGSISGNVVTVDSGDDFIAIVSVINYVQAADNSITTTIFNRTEVNSVKSPRFAVLTDSSLTNAQITDLTLWNSSFPQVDPNRLELVINGNANDYIYILVDDVYTLTGIKNDLGLEDIEEFDVSTQDGYKVYKLTDSLPLDNASFEYTLISGATTSTSSNIDLSVSTKLLTGVDSDLESNTINVFTDGTSGLVASLPSTPSSGDVVHVSNLSGNTDNEIGLSGNVLQGTYTDNLVLNDATASFTLIYVNKTLGWNIIGLN